MPPKQPKRRKSTAKPSSPLKGAIDSVATKGSVRRLARRGGVKRLTHSVLPEMSHVIRGFVKSVIQVAISYTMHAKRTTVVATDIIHALRKKGQHLYGYV